MSDKQIHAAFNAKVKPTEWDNELKISRDNELKISRTVEPDIRLGYTETFEHINKQLTLAKIVNK
jgi:hypothetical protein